MISQSKLKEVISYNPETGKFTWIECDARRVSAGDEAGYKCNTSGYIYITVFGRRYQAHRLAWLYVHGYLPKKRLDHDDQNKANNRISNLNEVTHQQNMRNMKKKINNTSGATGVWWSERLKKWRATYIHKQKKTPFRLFC